MEASAEGRVSVVADAEPSDILAARQRAMAEFVDWLPLAVERSTEAGWISMPEPGRRWRYTVRVFAVERDVRVEERLHDEPISGGSTP